MADEIIKMIVESKLILPDKNDTVLLHTDASSKSWGATCSVKQKGVISYHGGTFSSRIINTYSIFAKELLGLLHGLEYNKEFIIRAPSVNISVDNLAAVMSSTATKHHTKSADIINIMRIQQILSMCKGEVSIKHCSGSSNLCADFLSRLLYSKNDNPVAHMESMSFKDNSEETIFIPSVGEVSILQEDVLFDKEQYLLLKEEHKSHHYSLEKSLEMLKEHKRETNRKLIKRIIDECEECCTIPRKIAPYGKISLKPLPHRPLDDCLLYTSPSPRD